MSAPQTTSRQRTATRRDLIVAASCGAFVALMVGAAYAAVPLYDWFCRATGFDGTPRVAGAAPGQMLDRTVEVRFDANVSGGLPWKFEPERNTIRVKLGEVVTVNYSVTNLAARETIGEASYNVTPLAIGGYFNKINCFCFTEQRFAPGERREMAVVFYIDPKLAEDTEQAGLSTITLSYTFYAVKQPARPVAASGAGNAGRTNGELQTR